MIDIAIFGAGGFGKEVACLINRINEKEPTWNLVGFFDDNPALKGMMISHFAPCLGGIDELNAYQEELFLVIAIANPKIVKTVVGKINNPLITFPNLIHPSFVVSDPETFEIGRGNIIQANCSVSVDVKIGDFNILNGSVVLGHDVNMGSFNTLMPAVRISGGVTINDENFFGVSSIVLQQITVGNHVRLGAGSVLMTKPKDGNLYMGNPAKKTEF
jgi:sugar O-acyltransferase (sialic acid O-acetyltransferase NeuD family)